jgi:hypothetical protein
MSSRCRNSRRAKGVIPREYRNSALEREFFLRLPITGFKTQVTCKIGTREIAKEQ